MVRLAAPPSLQAFMTPSRPADHPDIKKPRIGVLLLNLGTPDGTDYWNVRRYLSEFLSDPRVIETPQAIWQPILQGVILSVRPQKSGANYERIWDKQAGDSPLRVITRRQTADLQRRRTHHLDYVTSLIERAQVIESLDAANRAEVTGVAV